MQVIIAEGTIKEIAALVLELQERHMELLDPCVAQNKPIMKNVESRCIENEDGTVTLR